jgi:predicted nuclease of predicted toxin-antitoxin system
MSLSFLADENISPTVVKALRDAGFDVSDIKEKGLFAISDKQVIRKAYAEDRVVLTHDRDFGNLLNNPLTSHKGVVLVRYGDQSPDNVSKRIVPLLESLKGRVKYALVIVTDDAVKIHSK